jgi:rubrerythrin
MISDVFLITQQDYPKIFECFEAISHDCGAHAGHHNYAVPEVYETRLDSFEEQLNKLSDAEREDFCIGESYDMTRIAERDGYKEVADFLNDFFDNWSSVNDMVQID